MLLGLAEFTRIAREVSEGGFEFVAFDFETTGLRARAGDRAFIMGFCLSGAHGLETHSVLLENNKVPLIMLEFFSSKTTRYLAHNAKFELGFLRHQFGIEVAGPVWDTEVFATTECNKFTKSSGGKGYSLQACAERMGLSKHAPMLAWLKKNKKQYHKAPLDLVVPYVEQDAKLSALLYQQQCQTFKAWQKSDIPISKVVRLELDTTKNLFNMEDAGLLLDVDYCHEAMNYESQRAEHATLEFERLAGVPFVDSAKTLTPIFEAAGLPYGRTPTGRPSFDWDALQLSKDHPVVKTIMDRREALKRASTYWENFIALHIDGVIYPNINQVGAGSFRFSAREPNVQNWPDDTRDKNCQYPIRRAFKARPGCKIVSMDYAQMELRMMCDEAGDMGMIEAIASGRDFHQETANEAGVPRGLAKNGRFAKLYGAGVPRVATTLGVPESTAKRICESIDRSSPQVARYTRQLIKYVECAPFGYNWLGRRFYFDRGFAYKYPNYRIQGGCAEILRIAIHDVMAFLKKETGGRSYVLIPIHDELVMNIHAQDMHLLPQIRAIMIAAHKSKRFLAMDVSVSIGDNFHDLEEITL